VNEALPHTAEPRKQRTGDSAGGGLEAHPSGVKQPSCSTSPARWPLALPTALAMGDSMTRMPRCFSSSRSCQGCGELIGWSETRIFYTPQRWEPGRECAAALQHEPECCQLGAPCPRHRPHIANLVCGHQHLPVCEQRHIPAPQKHLQPTNRQTAAFHLGIDGVRGAPPR
jgi:hypothetical protein